MHIYMSSLLTFFCFVNQNITNDYSGLKVNSQPDHSHWYFARYYGPNWFFRQVYACFH